MHRASVSRGDKGNTGIDGLWFIPGGQVAMVVVERQERAFWIREPGRGEIRPVLVPAPADDEVLVRTLFSGVSQGTETLVFRGGVPPDQHARMRAPHQDGEFPGPVKYGYLSVGRVEGGVPALRGRTVFCLHPHQTAYVVPMADAVVVPDDVPPARAVLAGTVETAVNALWDAGPDGGRPGRRRGGRDGRLLRRSAADRHPGSRDHPGRHRPHPRRRCGGAGRRVRVTGRRPGRPRPGRARERDLRRPATLARAAARRTVSSST